MTFISRNFSTYPIAVEVPAAPNCTLVVRPPRAALVTSVGVPPPADWYTPQNQFTGCDDELPPCQAVAFVTW